jgi:hypothetical protein
MAVAAIVCDEGHFMAVFCLLVKYQDMKAIS